MNQGDILAQRFRIDGFAGKGGMGTVYRARDLTSSATVALKVLRFAGPEDVERFGREAELLSRLNAPGIVRYVAHGVSDDGLHFLAMEWVEGTTLAEVLESVGMPLGQTVEMAVAVAVGLSALHKAGIVHRDIKPRNIIFPRGQISEAKIIDLGLARRATLSSLTKTGAIIGSPGYMSPEQARGRRQIDGRSDLFSLGATLYECLTGTVAFKAGSLFALQTKILLWTPPPLRSLNPQVSAGLEALVTELLDKDPERRPVDAEAVRARLEALAEREESPGRVVARRAGTSSSTMQVDGVPAPGEQVRDFLIMAGTEDKELAETLAAVDVDALAADLEARGAVCERVGAGPIIAAFSRPGPVAQATPLALAAAAVVRRALPPSVPVVMVVSDGAASGMSELAERAATVASAEAIELLFRGARHPGRGLLRLDERLVSQLSTQHALVRGKAGWYLPLSP